MLEMKTKFGGLILLTLVLGVASFWLALWLGWDWGIIATIAILLIVIFDK